MQSKYNKSKHVLVELPEVSEPVYGGKSAKDNPHIPLMDLAYYHRKINEYEQHIASLREIPAQPGTIWEEDKLYEEDVDYEVWGLDEWKWTGPLPGKIFATQIPKENEAELWLEVIMLFNKHTKPLELIGELKEKYTITKKTV